MKKVALVTYSKQPELFDGDNLLVEPFRKQGIIAEAVPWDKKGMPWKNFDLIILRSTWNYHMKTQEFLKWLEFLESRKVKLWNPQNIIRWNINKKYLLDLERMGIPIIPTLIINKESTKDIPRIVTDNKWGEIIIKPTIGNSAYNTYKFKVNGLESKLSRLIEKIPEKELIIQPFMKRINDEGEYSFIFFNKQYSHTVLKKTKKNEFRSQREFGGQEFKIEPGQNLISQAKQILDKIESPLLYARVDGLDINGQFQLMELELTEPYLFFEKETLAPEKFVQAAISLLM